MSAVFSTQVLTKTLRHYNGRLTRLLHIRTERDHISIMAAAHVSSTYALNKTSCHYNVRLIRRTVPAAELDRSHDQVGPCTFPDQDPSRRTNQYQGVKRDFTSLQ